MQNKNISEMTKFKRLNSNHPRPQLVRDNWQNLDGQWDYAITDRPQEPDHYEGKITVPFAPETKLSHVERVLQPKQTLWYHRTIGLPEHTEDERLVLHFGAVDQYCRVFVDRQLIFEHTGGYWPFDVELNDEQKRTVDLIIAVQDSTDQSDEAYGKQSLTPKEGWVQSTSGIWQTVWLETVPKVYVTQLTMTPNVDDATIRIAVQLNIESRVETQVTVYEDDQVVAETHGSAHTFTIPINNPRLWSPDAPFLYDLTLTAGADTVRSYFGMRQISRGRDEHDRAQFLLNDTPIFQSGIIDQGVWPESGPTAPDADAMQRDLETVKGLGFNMIRKLAKIEPLRWYALCDHLGLLVWQDFVPGGEPLRRTRARLQKFLNRNVNDHDYKTFGRLSTRGREHFVRDAKRTIQLLYNAPSVVVWTPFNAGDGQFDALRIASIVRREDDTRLIDHAAGGYDQGGGDFRSSQSLQVIARLKRDKIGRIQALSAIGDENFGELTERRPIKRLLNQTHKTKHSLSQALRHLYTKDLQPLIPAGLAVVTYNQLTDTESEANGLQTVDRQLKVDPQLIKGLNATLFSAFQLPPK